MKVDFAIITMRPEEQEAIHIRFTPRPYADPSSQQRYGISQLQTRSGKNCAVAIASPIRRGNDASQQLANRMISDLDPQMLLVVGIGGGVPDNDFTLGDVIVSSYHSQLRCQRYQRERNQRRCYRRNSSRHQQYHR